MQFLPVPIARDRPVHELATARTLPWNMSLEARVGPNHVRRRSDIVFCLGDVAGYTEARGYTITFCSGLTTMRSRSTCNSTPRRRRWRT